MKKYASLLLFALLLNGCDDGDLTVETIDFKDITATSCDATNALIYKLKPQEALILQMPENQLATQPDTITHTLDNSQYRFFYRTYDGVISKSNICDAIPPATPNINQEWYAIGGQIEIVTTAVYKTPPPTDGHTEIEAYNHNITFNGITFSKPGPTQVEDNFVFGDFKTTVTPVVVGFTDEVAKYCDVQNKVYNNNLSNSLVIENLEKGLIEPEDTPVDKPRKGLINSNSGGTPAVISNNVYYRTYNSNLPETTRDYYCTNTVPANPTVKDTWTGITGVANVSGIIEVTTTHSNNVYKHKIVLRNASLKKGNNTFKLATEFVLGTVTTVKP